MAKAEWKPAKLDQLGFVGRGKSKHRPRNDAILYGGPYPFFQTGDIKAANFRLTEYSQTYSYAGLAQSKLWKPGTLCITIAANIAESAILGIEGCFPDSVVGFVADPDKADVRFIKYYMEILKLQMQSVARGTTQDNLSVEKLLNFDFLVPPRPVQRRIAGILSTYDELIENSQRRIKILETMARTLYREWFIHFRFPGHEKIPLVASSLGEIPKGWVVKSIQQFGTVVTGKTPSKADVGLYGDAVPFVKTPDMHGNMFILSTSDSLSLAGAGSQANKTLPVGSICVSCIGTIGVVSLTTENCQTNQQINSVVLANNISREFLFLSLQDAKQMLENLGSNGATMGNVNKSKFEAMEIVCPSDGLLAHYHRLAEPMFSQILGLLRQIQNLRRTRDLLLPRLLSGQVQLNVDAAEQHLAEAQTALLPVTNAKKSLVQSVRPAPVEGLLNENSKRQEPFDKLRANGEAGQARPHNSVQPSTYTAAVLTVAEAAPPPYAADKPPDINDTERTDVLCAIRALFSDGVARDRSTTIRDLSHALGYQRTGSRIHEVLATDLLTAVRRGIMVNEGGQYSLGFRSLADCTRDSLKNDFESAIGRGWINRDDAVRAFARWLGFARVGKVIEETSRSLINGLIREDRLEADGQMIRRR